MGERTVAHAGGQPSLRAGRADAGPRRGLALEAWLPHGDRLPAATWARRHRFLVVVLLAHAVAVPAFGVASGYAAWHAILEGGISLAVLAFAGAALPLPRRARSLVVSTGLVASSAVLVHFAGGYIEAHFHFFATLLLVAFYEDWLALALANAYVVLHHGFGALVAPDAIFNHPAAQAHPFAWVAVHGLAVLFFTALALLWWRLNDELRAQKDAALAEVAAHEEELERANAELRELDRLKSEFVAVASHELRTPLTSVLGFATTLRVRWETLSEEDRRTYVELVDEQARRLGRLVGNLLDMSRIESGAVRPSPHVVELAPVARRAAASAGAEAALDVPEGLSVYADPDHVEQILVNYLANAVRHGRPPVEIEARASGGAVEVRVVDSGDGVPPELAARLFERFAQGSTTRTSGSGLGLAIVRGLAAANGGEAWYEGNGWGATFAVRLPAGAGYGESSRRSTTGLSRSAVVQPPTV